MILNHLMGLYTHPKQEWHAIEKNHEALKSSLSHVILIALIPAVCSFIATAYIGWNPGRVIRFISHHKAPCLCLWECTLV